MSDREKEVFRPSTEGKTITTKKWERFHVLDTTGPLILFKGEMEEIEAAAKATHMPLRDWITSRIKACLAAET